MKPAIEVLFFEGCPHAAGAIRLAEDAASRLLPGVEVLRVRVDSADEAVRLGFPGSPTIRVDGRDVAGRVPGPPALSCRVYEGGAGVPPEWMVEAAMLRALSPRHILIMCVANSVRSQMAEGIARSLAPAGVAVSSAGSISSMVHPMAIRAVGEIGIDISVQRSKAVEDIDTAGIDAVITLCAEQACPAPLVKVPRVHWSLPDPTGTPDEQDRMAGFRAARDELRRRLEILFDGWRRCG